MIVRVQSGLPFTLSDSTADSLDRVPNSSRLPGTSTIDLLLRRPLRLGRTSGGIYLDIRNLLDRRNVVAVRRDSGTPLATNDALEAMVPTSSPAPCRVEAPGRLLVNPPQSPDPQVIRDHVPRSGLS